MARPNPIREELDAIADDLYKKYPGVIVGIAVPGPNGRTRTIVRYRGPFETRYWIAHAIWSSTPDPPTQPETP